MKYYDAAVIGGGILGCFAARNLRKWNISTVLLEAADDVCTGITKANSAIVYAGYDNKPGSLKAEMTVRGNASFGDLCADLEVPFSRCGSLLVTYDEASVPRLKKKLKQGIQNGVPGLQFLTGEEACAMEPMLRTGVAGALYAPSTGTVNPWQLGIAAYENALQNGAEALLGAKVTSIRKTQEGYEVQAGNHVICCKAVINCAGMYADKVQELLFESSVQLKLDGAEYLVFDRFVEKPDKVIFLQATTCGKGITAIPCVEGNLLISGVRKDLNAPFSTTREGTEENVHAAKELLPELDVSQIIRSFGAVRPNPHTPQGDNISDYCICNPGPGFFSLIGIKTPGLTCSNELGQYVAAQCATYLNASPNPDFDPHRSAISPASGRIVCQCEGITEGQILQAIARGARTVEAVKRRVGSGMGACQGNRCSTEIVKLLKKSGITPDPVF